MDNDIPAGIYESRIDTTDGDGNGLGAGTDGPAGKGTAVNRPMEVVQALRSVNPVRAPRPVERAMLGVPEPVRHFSGVMVARDP